MESVMNKLTEDVVIDILSRLAVKSLLRFRSVCKVWCNLIKSSDFIAMHFNHPTTENDHRVLVKRCLTDGVTNMLSIHYNTESLSIVSPDLQIPYLDNECVQVVGPCSGLVCITDKEIIVLCNPATREFTLLPARPFGCPQDMYCYYRAVGFGFDANTNDCKVIRIVDLMDDDDYTFHIFKAELYRRSTDSWSKIDFALPDIHYEPCFETIFHEANHWKAMRDYHEEILSYNITTEVFQEFDFPKGCPPHDGKRKCLTVLNEFLAMFYYTCPMVRTDQQFVDVWAMREYGVPESWTKQFTIGPLSNIEYPITLRNDSSILFERTNGQLTSCTFDTQEVKEFDIVGSPSTLRALVYKESLVSIRRESDHGAPWN